MIRFLIVPKQTKKSSKTGFIQGEPKVMTFEAASHTSMEDAEMQADALIKDLEENNFMLRQNYTVLILTK
jgi:hypothetical protein